MKHKERRDSSMWGGEAEFRAGDGDTPIIQGYAAVFGRKTFINDFWGGFEETIRHGAFADVLSENQDVVGLFNHKEDNVLGRTSADSVTLEERKAGLYDTITPDMDSPVAQHVVANVRAKNITGQSFAFTVKEEIWTFSKKKDVADKREIVKVEVLYDVGPVTYPAFPQTSVGMREVSKVHMEARAKHGEKVDERVARAHNLFLDSRSDEAQDDKYVMVQVPRSFMAEYFSVDGRNADKEPDKTPAENEPSAGEEREKDGQKPGQKPEARADFETEIGEIVEIEQEDGSILKIRRTENLKTLDENGKAVEYLNWEVVTDDSEEPEEERDELRGSLAEVELLEAELQAKKVS